MLVLLFGGIMKDESSGRGSLSPDSTGAQVRTHRRGPSTVSCTRGPLALAASRAIFVMAPLVASVLNAQTRFLYATNETGGTVSAYAIDTSTGALSRLAG